MVALGQHHARGSGLIGEFVRTDPNAAVPRGDPETHGLGEGTVVGIKARHQSPTAAIRELDRYEAQYLDHRDPVTLGRQLSALLRRGMLAYAPRHEVAGLTGERWLLWLDQGMPVPYFHTEGGKSLLQLPYRDPESDLSDVDVDALLSAVRMRLSVPVGGHA